MPIANSVDLHVYLTCNSTKPAFKPDWYATICRRFKQCKTAAELRDFAEFFRREVERATGKPVMVAEK